MEEGKILIIKTLKKLDIKDLKNNKNVYEAIVIEKIYNSKSPFPNKWENNSIKVNIVTDLPIEEAEVDGNLSMIDRYKRENIKNPKYSVIRVIDFKIDKCRKFKGSEPVKTDTNAPVFNERFYLTDFEFVKPNQKYITKTERLQILEKQVEPLISENKSLKVENRNLKIELDKIKSTISGEKIKGKRGRKSQKDIKNALFKPVESPTNHKTSEVDKTLDSETNLSQNSNNDFDGDFDLGEI